MAQEGKTERPTARRKKEAREEGNVPKSVEINSAVVLLGAIAALTALGPALMQRLEATMSDGLQRISTPDVADHGLGSLAGWSLAAIVGTAGPIILAVGLVGLLANVAQVGIRLRPVPLKPSLSRINPGKNLKRLAGKDGFVEALKAAVKTAVIGIVAFFTVSPQLHQLGALVGMPPDALLRHIGSLVAGIVFKVGGAFLLVAGADYAWQRFRNDQSLKMSRDEIRQELKQTDISPELKRAIRRKQIEKSRRRMLADVPTADVVVVNPTHFAVALRYDGTRPAPELVAKGADLIAAAIRKVAEEHAIPIVHNAPLAQALYREVELGQTIPESFFTAVAEVLAFVYRTAGRRLRLKKRARRSITGAHALGASPTPRGG